jgi:hypothetical protein
MKKDNSNAKKAIVYGANYLARPLGNLAKEGLNLGHPYTALGFGLADIIAGSSDEVRGNVINRMIKVGGSAYFSFLTLKNLVEFIEGDYSGLKDFPFNLSMAGSLGSDLKDLYKESGKSFFTDIKDMTKGKFF